VRHAPFGVGASREPVLTEVVVVHAAAEQMPANNQDAVTHGQLSLLFADPTGEVPELGSQVGLATVCGRPGALMEDLTEPSVALVRLAGAAFAAGDVVARAHARPRGEVCGGREPAHVRADLGDDALSRWAGVHPWPATARRRARRRPWREGRTRPRSSRCGRAGRSREGRR